MLWYMADKHILRNSMPTALLKLNCFLSTTVETQCTFQISPWWFSDYCRHHITWSTQTVLLHHHSEDIMVLIWQLARDMPMNDINRKLITLLINSFFLKSQNLISLRKQPSFFAAGPSDRSEEGLLTRVRLFSDCQIVSGHHFFWCIKQIACLFCLISNFDTSSLIIKLKSRYFWLIKQERLLIKVPITLSQFLFFSKVNIENKP